MNYKVVSLFSGAGGLDLGFKNAGLDIVWANEFDSKIWKTYESNHHNFLDKRSVSVISTDEIPECDVIIGGPPCQSWSLAGSHRGIKDPRGKLIYDYIRILEAKKPKVFLFENVPGMLSKKHEEDFLAMVESMRNIGYNVTYELVNAADYGVPQDRKRVIVIGVRDDIKEKIIIPSKEPKINLRTVLAHIEELAVPALPKNKANHDLKIANHEYFIGDYSSMYLSRNRVRSYDEQSFTIQASGRHAPMHPKFPKMEKIGVNKMKFADGYEYRRLSIRECAIIQTFPDEFEFFYENLGDGYKMVGNAVPVKLAEKFATSIKQLLDSITCE